MSFSQYQRHGGSTQVVQQQQQQALQWNGTAWVSVAPSSSSSSQVSRSSTHSSGLGGGSYRAAPAPVGASLPLRHTPPTSIPPDAVRVYTEYYHGWQAILKDREQRLKGMDYRTPVAERTALETEIGWARYYGDESSRAAHHFYQHPHTMPTDFELPPAPPKASAARPPAPASTSSSSWASVAAPRTTTAAAADTSSSAPSESLAQWVSVCLGRCSTPDQKKKVQAEIEARIAKSIQDGTYPRKDWSREPLVEVPPATAVPQPSPSSYHPTSHSTGRHATNPSYSGHSGTRASASQGNSSYYGPGAASHPSAHPHVSSSSSSISPPPSSSSYNPYSSQQQQQSVSPSKRALDVSQEDDFLAFKKQKKHKTTKNKKAKLFTTTTTTSLGNHKYVNPDRLDGQRYASGSGNGFEKSSQALARRRDRFSGAGGLAEASLASASRHSAHDDKYMGKSTISGGGSSGWSALLGNAATEEYAFERMTVKGTCTVLEKSYLRLTAPPRAELVRPQPILEEHLKNLLEEYYGKHAAAARNGAVPKRRKKRRDYTWFCSQLKAVRQDLTIQRIRDAFAVEVYEAHARIALREGDLNEFNQSQTQLRELYDQLAKEEGATTKQGLEHQGEFLAYRLLYHVLLTTNDSYEAGTSEISKILSELVGEVGEDPCVAHAVKVREALAAGDYLRFFRLHHDAPRSGRFLTERMVPTMRLRALKRIARAYRPSIDVETCVAVLLGFESTKEGTDWLESCGCVLSDDRRVLRTKESDGAIHEPEPETKNSLI